MERPSSFIFANIKYIILRLAQQLSPPGIFLAVATGEDTAPSTESIQSFYLWPREMFIQRFLRLESLYPSLPVAPAPAEYNRLEPGMSLTYRCYLSSGLKKHINSDLKQLVHLSEKMNF